MNALKIKMRDGCARQCRKRLLSVLAARANHTRNCFISEVTRDEGGASKCTRGAPIRPEITCIGSVPVRNRPTSFRSRLPETIISCHRTIQINHHFCDAVLCRSYTTLVRGQSKLFANRRLDTSAIENLLFDFGSRYRLSAHRLDRQLLKSVPAGETILRRSSCVRA